MEIAAMLRVTHSTWSHERPILHCLKSSDLKTGVGLSLTTPTALTTLFLPTLCLLLRCIIPKHLCGLATRC
ncbi:hypothetical protein BDW74DRAFT_44824 [Aspergillus multicolor]|uniref:uncharacterized protein n=1 Tax=Aspergillus multicolor TaxID=41759 RepID=UPI003CCE2575